MKTKDAASKWGVSERAVQGWCKDGWVMTAVFDEARRIWEIDDKALCPLKFSKANQEKYISRLALILTALSTRKTIPPEKLGCDNESLQEHFDDLLHAKLIKKRKIKQNSDFFIKYCPTIAGGKFLESRKGLKRIVEGLSPLIAAFSEGATKAILDKNN